MAGAGFPAADGVAVVRAMIAAIEDSAKDLSAIDGATGDGDHGVNMAKGFALCGQRLDAGSAGFAEALGVLGGVLMTEIGGAMGPLYGSFFEEMGRAGANAPEITPEVLGRMLKAGKDAVVDLGGATVGDKTMVDALAPAVDAFEKARVSGADFPACLNAMAAAAEAGKEATRGLVAKLGRASRLGERSRGTLDAGAASCALLLATLARSVTGLLRPRS